MRSVTRHGFDLPWGSGSPGASPVLRTRRACSRPTPGGRLRAQGIDPEARTFNTVIIACNMSSQAVEAVRVYERMLAAGAQPTATTFTALIRCAGAAAWGALGFIIRVYVIGRKRAILKP